MFIFKEEPWRQTLLRLILHPCDVGERKTSVEPCSMQGSRRRQECVLTSSVVLPISFPLHLRQLDPYRLFVLAVVDVDCGEVKKTTPSKRAKKKIGPCWPSTNV